MLMNEYEAIEKQGKNRLHKDFNHYFRRFEAELEIRDLASRFPNSYHIGLFMCLVKPEEPNLQYYSTE